MEPQRAIPDNIESFYHDQSFGKHQPSAIVPDNTTFAQFCLVNSIAVSEHLPTRSAEISTPGSHLGPETAPSHPTQLNQHPWLPSQISGGRFWDFATASDLVEDENGQGSMGVIRKKTASRGTEAGTKFHCDVCSVDVTSTVCSPQHIKR
jgi:hypothetical protein